jgi:hypothetical protein
MCRSNESMNRSRATTAYVFWSTVFGHGGAFEGLGEDRSMGQGARAITRAPPLVSHQGVLQRTRLSLVHGLKLSHLEDELNARLNV